MKSFSFLSFSAAYALVALLIPALAFAQKAEFSVQPFAAKTTQPAITLIMEGQPKNVAEVLTRKIEKASGVKVQSYKGNIDVFPAAKVAEISPSAVFDIYFRVEKPSKEDTKNSRVTMFLSLGNETNFVTQDKYASEIANASAMLEKMVAEVRIYELQLAAELQAKVIAEEEAKQRELEKAMTLLEKKKADILQEIETNRASQEKQKSVVAEAKGRQQELQTQLQSMGASLPPTTPTPQPAGNK